jgi:hypothetical protein
MNENKTTHPYRCSHAVHVWYTLSVNKPVITGSGKLRSIASGRMLGRKLYFKVKIEAEESFDSWVTKLEAGKYVGEVRQLLNGNLVRSYTNIATHLSQVRVPRAKSTISTGEDNA